MNLTSNFFNKKANKNHLHQSSEHNKIKNVKLKLDFSSFSPKKGKVKIGVLDYLDPIDEEIKAISEQLLLSSRKNLEIDNNKLLNQAEEDIINIQSILTQDNLFNDAENNISFFDIICFILKKNTKKLVENELLKIYFLRLEKLVALFKPLNVNLNDMLSKLVGHIKYQKKLKDNILFKEGDKGDKFYIILKGEVGILIQQEKIINSTVIEFMKCLIVLYLYQEKSLVNKLIMNNRDILKFDERCFQTLMDTFKFYHFFKEFSIIKTQYKGVTDFIHIESKIDNFLYKKNGFSSHDSFITLKPNGIEEILYNYYSNVINNMQNLFFTEINNENIENKNNIVSKLRNNLINNPTNLSELGLYARSHGYNEKKCKTVEFFNKIYYINEISTSFIYGCNVQNYIERLSFEQIINLIRFDTKDNFTEMFEEKKNFKYYNYVEVNHLKDGNVFGELALINPSKKRTATIIIKEDCHLGILNKEIYDLSIKSAQDKLRIRNVIYFLNGPIFKDVSNNYFLNNYFFRFKKRVFNQGEVLFRRGEERTKIYFIIKGELRLGGKMTLHKMTEIIEYLSVPKQPDDGGLANKFCQDNYQFKKYYEEYKRIMRFYVLKDKEISGLDDITKNNINLFDCVCVSSEPTEVHELDYKIFKKALEDKIIKQNNEDYIMMKKEILMNRLYRQRDSIAQNVFNRIKAFSVQLALNKQLNEEKSIDNNLKTMNNFFSLGNSVLNKNIASFLEDSQSGNNTNYVIKNSNSFSKKLPILSNSKNLSFNTEFNKNRTNLNLKNDSSINNANSLYSNDSKKPMQVKEADLRGKEKSLILLQINTDENIEKNKKEIKLIRNNTNNRIGIASYIKNNNIKNKINSYKKNPRLMRMDIKNMKKCITPSSDLLMKEFTKRYIEPVKTPYHKHRFLYENQKIFEPLLYNTNSINNKSINNKSINNKSIEGKKYVDKTTKTTINFNKTEENTKEYIIRKRVVYSTDCQEYEISEISKINKKNINFNSSRNPVNKINYIDNQMEENYKDIFMIDCLCLDKWEEKTNKNARKEKPKLRGKKINNIKYIYSYNY